MSALTDSSSPSPNSLKVCEILHRDSLFDVEGESNGFIAKGSSRFPGNKIGLPSYNNSFSVLLADQ